LCWHYTWSKINDDDDDDDDEDDDENRGILTE